MFAAWFLWAAGLAPSKWSFEVPLSFQNRVLFYFIYCRLTQKHVVNSVWCVQLEAGWFLELGWIWEPSYSREYLYCPWAKSYFLWVLDWSSQVIGALWTLFLSKRNKKASTGGSGLVMAVAMKIRAFMERCSYAKHLTRLFPFPPPHDPMQYCCYYIHFTDGKTEALKD